MGHQSLLLDHLERVKGLQLEDMVYPEDEGDRSVGGPRPVVTRDR